MNLSVKQLNILYNLTDNALKADEIIQLIGKARHDYYYPLYLLTKLNTLRDRFRWYIQRKAKKAEKQTDAEEQKFICEECEKPFYDILLHHKKGTYCLCDEGECNICGLGEN